MLDLYGISETKIEVLFGKALIDSPHFHIKKGVWEKPFTGSHFVE